MKIKRNPEFSPLPDSYIDYISKRFDNTEKILHETYGVFRLDIKKRKRLLKSLKKGIDILKVHEEILKTHRSTKERLKDYEKIYEAITKEAGELESVLDISAGINPVSLVYSKQPSEYIATELAQDDVNFLNKYFKIMKINGIAIQADLLNVKKFPKTKICFLFKVLDNLETLKRNESKNLLKKIPAEYIIVSFPKITISGKKLNTKRLIWFNKIVKSKKLLETKNEIFFIINNKKEL